MSRAKQAQAACRQQGRRFHITHDKSCAWWSCHASSAMLFVPANKQLQSFIQIFDFRLLFSFLQISCQFK